METPVCTEFRRAEEETACCGLRHYGMLLTNGVGRNRPEMVVGWYHSHPGFGCWLSGVDINTQQARLAPLQSPCSVQSCTQLHVSMYSQLWSTVRRS